MILEPKSCVIEGEHSARTGRMGNSEIESPLLQENGANGLRANEQGDAPVRESRDGVSLALKLWSRTIIFVVLLCCLGATVLLLSSPQSPKNARLRNGGAIQIAHQETDELNYFSAQHTKFHFQPPDNFMSDPCAPIYYNGYYHLWYQWNPFGRTWGNMTWGHTVSTDLIHWKYLGVSLKPSEWYDRQGTWSGYITIVNDVPVVLYTSGRGLFGGDANQSISMAYPADPSDPLLREWVKYDNNPLIYTPEGPQFSSQAFRDPTTAWREEGDKLWRLAIPSVFIQPDHSRDGIGLMYTSKDFYHWEREETFLHRVKGTGTWECLDLFPTIPESEVGGPPLNPEYYHDGLAYVLKAGMDETRIDYYAMGTYSTKTHTFTADDPEHDLGIGLRYDYGRFYASKTFYDTTKNRRVLWGYVHESDSEDDDRSKGWACLQSIPRTVWLDPKTKKNVLQWPVEELDVLRGAHVSYTDITLQPEEVLKVDGGDGQQLDIVVSFEKPTQSFKSDWWFELDWNYDCKGGSDKRGVYGPFGLIVLADEDRIEHSDIFFFLAQKQDGEWGTIVCSDQSRSSLYWNLDKTIYGKTLEVVEDDDSLSFRVLVDHSIVETYVQGGRFAITARMYPTLAIGSAAKLFLFNNGTSPIKVKSLDVYQMGSVTMTNL